MTSDSVDPARVAALGGELRCPLCEYDLRATTENRCPECGYPFDWEELRDPAKRLHGYLFEHHPERNVSSFVQTLLGGIRPKRFWRTLFPTQPSRIRRLLLYWAIAGFLSFAVLAGQFVLTVIVHDTEARMRAQRFVAGFAQYDSEFQARVLKAYKTPQSFVDMNYVRWPQRQFLRWVWRDPTFGIYAISSILWLSWPWITLAGLLIFQASMRKARVGTIHVLRCVLYTGDIALWWSICAAVLMLTDLARFGVGRPMRNVTSITTQWVPALSLLALLFATYRLASAYRHYLRFRHSLMTAILVQIIVALLIFKLALDWNHIF